MTKYSEIEVKTAKNLLEHGYMWIVRNETGRLFAHFAKPCKCKANNVWGSFGFSTSVCDFVPIFQSIRFDDKEPVSLESIVHPQILDDAEKKYLSKVLGPVRNNVYRIRKVCNAYESREFIAVQGFFGGSNCTFLQDFEPGTMFKGMEPNRWYSLGELGL